MYSVEAPGKLLLLGEYLALLQHPCIGIPLNIKTRATYYAEDIPLHIDSEIEIPQDFYKHLNSILIQLSFPVLHGKISIQSDIPIASGLGSSAAFCVCVAKIILHNNNDEQDTHKIWCIAHALEGFFHKTASGIDTAISAFHTPLLLSPTMQIPEHFVLPIENLPSFLAQSIILPDLHIIYASIPRSQPNTLIIPEILTNLKNMSGEKDSPLGKLIQQHTLAIQLIKDYKHTSNYNAFLKNFGMCITNIQTQLEILKISSKQIDRKIHLMKKLNAPSQNASPTMFCKLSGAGRGGAFFAILESAENKKKLIKVLSESPDFVESLLVLNQE